MAGKIQNADVKSLAELTGLGATKTQLLNTDKMYSPKTDNVLETDLRKNNSAVVAPTSANDNTQNYEVGSRWVDTAAQKIYFCIDATTGAAVWKESGSSAAPSGGGGGELADLLYLADSRDLLDTTPTSASLVDIGAGKTDVGLYDGTNKLFRLNYDATKTVTGTGTAMTLSSAPSFTIKAGDVLINNATGESKRITAISSQTSITIESAFLTNPSATAICVSQAVHTVDLNNYTNGGLGLSVASQYSANIDEIMLGYGDSTTLGDKIPDYGTAAAIAFAASTDNTSWTTTRTRVTSLSNSEVPVTCPTSNPNLYVRFFANKTSGSGAVNLLDYKVFFHKIVGQQVGANYYTAFARPTAGIIQNCTHGVVGGKSRFVFNFPYTRGLNSGEASGSVLEVTANGQLVPRFASGITDNSQAYFTEISDNAIEMDADYTNSGIDFQFKVQRINVVDTNTLNTTKVALHDDLLDQTLEAQVIPTFLTAFNGAPTTGQFRSDITNRANIPDLSAMLSVQMGPQRMMTQEIYPLQNEFGPLGQQVFGTVNDKFNQIRFVGGWTNQNGTGGQRPYGALVNDYIEIVFYGTGLNILNNTGNNPVLSYSVDGGSNVSFWSTTGSTVLNTRNYNTNQIIPVIAGLALGLHTIKIIATTGQCDAFGFEILTETTSLRAMPGTIAKGKYKNVLSAMQTVAYDSNFESGVLGTKGGCVLVYLKTDGTIGKALTPTNATALYMTNADHTNEDLIRTHNPREFGCGRSDDFSLAQAAANLAFTLDDGVTTLVGSNVYINSTNSAFGLGLNSTGFFTITFVGTGLDVMRMDVGSGQLTDNITITIDGTVQGTLSASNFAMSSLKICSGLPYGTHTVKFSRAAAIGGANFTLWAFNIYAPKKPALPIGSIELVQYYKMADYVAMTTFGIDLVGQGVIRKFCTREMILLSNYLLDGLQPGNFDGGFAVYATANGSIVKYTFFGTGIVFKGRREVGYANATISIDGNSNFSSYSTSAQGFGWTAATGALVTAGAAQQGCSVSINGLPLGLHTITITTTQAATFEWYCFDVISPIHAPAINGPYVLQNTLALGNNNFLDLRKFNTKDFPQANLPKTGKGVAIIGAPSTTSTVDVPIGDMTIPYYSEGEMVQIDFHNWVQCSVVGNAGYSVLYLNGIRLSTRFYALMSLAGYAQHVPIMYKVFLPKGWHLISGYFATSTGTGISENYREIFVTKLGAK